MFFGWLIPNIELKVADTPEAREALARFRYSIYVEDGGWDGRSVDHEGRRVVDALDDSPFATQLYVGELDDIQGTVRMLSFPPGQMPEDMRERYATDLLPHGDRLTLHEFGRFAIRRDKRGGLLYPGMARAAFLFAARLAPIGLGLLVCRPHLVRHYRKLGFRPYGAAPQRGAAGLTVPLVLVPWDVDYLDAMGAIIAREARRAYRHLSTPDLRDFAAALDADNQHIILESRRVLQEVEEAVMGPAPTQPAHGLPAKTVRMLVEKGFLMELGPGEHLMTQGMQEHEVYHLLEGRCEVLVDGARVAEVGPGQTLGELASVLEHRRRTATVRTLEPVRALVLSPPALRKLNQREPDAAFAVMSLLLRTMAGRLEATTRQLVA